MRTLITSLVMLLTLAFVPAHAEDKPKSVVAKPASAAASSLKGIGVVDVVGLMRDSKAAKSIEKQLNDRRKIYRDALATQEKKLKATEDSLLKQKGKLKPEEFEAKRKEFEKSVRELQQSAQSKHRALEKAAQESVAKLQGEISRIVADIAAKRQLKLVLTREQVVIVEQSLDITKEVLTALDKSLPDVKVTIAEKK